MLQLQDLGGKEKLIEKVMPKVIQNGSKIKLWASRAPIFEILGGFDRGLIFDDFWSGPKNKTNLKKLEKMICPGTVGRRG